MASGRHVLRSHLPASQGCFVLTSGYGVCVCVCVCVRVCVCVSTVESVSYRRFGIVLFRIVLLQSLSHFLQVLEPRFSGPRTGRGPGLSCLLPSPMVDVDPAGAFVLLHTVDGIIFV